MNATPLVLSLFPGADLLGRAFEASEMCVVRGPEILLGQDIREWPFPPPGRLDGVIGGPPCQEFSTARHIGGNPSRHGDYIPLFWEIVRHCRPAWAVMENVPQATSHPAIPRDATPVIVSDFDCGGKTQRKRLFVFWPGIAVLSPQIQHRRGELSVMASSYKSGAKRAARGMRAGATPMEAGEAQGWPEIAETMLESGDKARLFPHRFVVHVLGNGVPRAMGQWVAGVIRQHYYPTEERLRA